MVGFFSKKQYAAIALNVGVAEDMLIYDLCGRRIMEVKTSGLYIINGEKRYVEVK